MTSRLLPPGSTRRKSAGLVEAQSAAVEPAEATLISGPPENIGLAILDYCAIGVTDFVVGGLRSAAEIAAFGRSVVPLVAAARSLIAHSVPLVSHRRSSPLHRQCRQWTWRRSSGHLP